jgi:hypothetical protein
MSPMRSPSSWLSKLREKRRVRRQQLAERTFQRQQDDLHRAGENAGADDARAASADAAAGAAGAVNTGGTGAGI